MTIEELKTYIADNNKIEYTLKSLGCHNIQYHNEHNYYSACFPNGDNPMGINIRNNKYLNYRSFSRNVSYDDNKDLISLVQYIKKCDLVEALKYLHKILGLEYSYVRKKKKENEKTTYDPLRIFKKVKKRRYNVLEFESIDEEELDCFVPYISIDWFREGIIKKTVDKFNLAYSFKRKRNVIPIRYWATGELMGFNMRTTLPNADDLGIKKYMITKGYPKDINLYGLWENRKEIEEKGYVTIFEAEKSCLKRDSLGDGTGVALQGHSISSEQVRIICGLNIREIVIALDKDVHIDEVRDMCDKFYGIRKVSYIYDKWKLLQDKDSPADASKKIYDFLFKYRVEYDKEEHEKYLRSLKR